MSLTKGGGEGYNSYNIIMKTYDIASNLIKLRLLTRRLLMCEDGEKKLISLKTKLLFLLSGGGRTPVAIMDALKISKPNLTMLGNALYEEGLIEREPLADRRSIQYLITDKGRSYLSERLKRINDNLDGKCSVELNDAIEKVINLLDET